jgi:hypothetical protein
MCRRASLRDVVAALQSARARAALYAVVRVRGGPATPGPCAAPLGTRLPTSWSSRTRRPDRTAALPVGPSASVCHARLPMPSYCGIEAGAPPFAATARAAQASFLSRGSVLPARAVHSRGADRRHRCQCGHHRRAASSGHLRRNQHP